MKEKELKYLEKVKKINYSIYAAIGVAVLDLFFLYMSIVNRAKGCLGLVILFTVILVVFPFLYYSIREDLKTKYKIDAKTEAIIKGKDLDYHHEFVKSEKYEAHSLNFYIGFALGMTVIGSLWPMIKFFLYKDDEEFKENVEIEKERLKGSFSGLILDGIILLFVVILKIAAKKLN